MHTDPLKINITTDASGDATIYTRVPAHGYVDRVVVVLGTSTSLDLTLSFTDEAGTVTVYSGTGIAASTRSRPSSNWRMDGQELKAVVANGGNAKTATVYVHFSDAPLAEITVESDIEIGAVELKDATGATRAAVTAANSASTTGNAVNVADANVLARLTSILDGTPGGLDHLAGPDFVSVDTTATGKTLATLLGEALNTGLKKLTLVPASAGVFWKDGNVAVTDSPVPTGGVELNIGKTQADTLKFIANSGTIGMMVYQEG